MQITSRMANFIAIFDNHEKLSGWEAPDSLKHDLVLN